MARSEVESDWGSKFELKLRGNCVTRSNRHTTTNGYL